LRMNRVSSDGPTLASQLNWNGMLTKSETGLESFFARSDCAAWSAVCCATAGPGLRHAMIATDNAIHTRFAEAPDRLRTTDPLSRLSLRPPFVMRSSFEPHSAAAVNSASTFSSSCRGPAEACTFSYGARKLAIRSYDKVTPSGR